MFHVLTRACKKLKSCPGADPSIKSVCGAVEDAMSQLKPPPLTGCAAAQRCFEKIDAMSCDDAADMSPHSVLTQFQDCAAATNC